MQLYEEITVQLQYTCPHFGFAQGHFSNEVPFIKLMGTLCSTCKQHANANSRLKPTATVVNSALLTNISISGSTHTHVHHALLFLLLSHARTLSLSLVLSTLRDSGTCLHIARAYLSSFSFHFQSVLAFLDKRLCGCACVCSLFSNVCVCFRIYRINLNKFLIIVTAKSNHFM